MNRWIPNLGNNISCAIDHTDTVISILAPVPVQGNVLTAKVKSIGVEWERNCRVSSAIVRLGIDEMILDEYVPAGNIPTPRDGLDDLETGNVPVGNVEGRKLRAECSDAVVPPLLTIPIKAATRHRFRTDQLHMIT